MTATGIRSGAGGKKATFCCASRLLYSERKPPIRTRGESRMIGMKHSPRTDLAAL